MTMEVSTPYTFAVRLPLDIVEARRRVERGLQDEGFGVLTEIDVTATLRAKLNVETDPYLILGACNPHLAHRALEISPSVGALLPCNVVLRQGISGEETVVEIAEPTTFLAIAATDGLSHIAGEASERLHRVAAALAGSPAME
jgi:uncharacterized protein (DUF302 family)